jgi:XTP/dITP diphosphohydrolase
VSATGFLLATRSDGKLRELSPMFAEAGLSVISLDAMGIEPSDEENDLESFETFEENALAKARHFYEVSGGMPTIADDSGLVVDALGGLPGVRSKRWSARADLSGSALDDENNATLVRAVASVADRRARYVCVAAFVSVGDSITCRGETTGRILDVPRGTGGFGYDPYFLSDELNCTFGEASAREKETVSHRGRAFRALLHHMLGGR